ncbi:MULTISPECIES: helix-turn-helix domain-containing protein [unclassified Rhizobium]|uniref:helix-turn-helix domain-containing protein n=1 Tax=unclassified Rhizobium TaxID=2613769 RepID=UPI001C838B6A|nr:MULTISPECIES: helix-turn-helix domain-containing protein [unclassified Rhizobium]MBX5248779.1 helix-turn-helix transcriptional regulator [Rhizobium sp. NLR3b]MBX5309539.1 helix-turn-helix transcriptional regulator [Rhizobium sp. NLR14b]
MENIGTEIARIRNGLSLTQGAVAQKAGLDQSRVSRIEKGEVIAQPEVERVIAALAQAGSTDAQHLLEFAQRDWPYFEPPSFWNPERGYLETAGETLSAIDAFLENDEHPWPLKRQIERRRDDLVKAATFLTRTHHNVAFIGDIGVGKSTGLSFLFDLLVPAALSDKSMDRVVLETGAGGTTICEVHVKRGPEFGLSLVPLSDGELRQLVADLCSSKWMANATTEKASGSEESVGVSREAERAIRNMSGLVRKREIVDGKATYFDPLTDLLRNCASEDEFRTRVLDLMQLTDRTQRELWYDSASRKHPLEWITETFRMVNNGRLSEVSLPKSIDLLVPEFGRNFGELDITIIDTKGVDDVAVREDLDLRLKDPRTTLIFCSRFNDAPGTSAKALLQHMRQTFTERFDTGKVAILALPRAGEARAMKDDTGENALTDDEGYEFKGMQVSGELLADDMGGVPVLFFNVESDDPTDVRGRILAQLNRMRSTAANHLLDVCAAVEELIENHETQALTAAVEEVAGRLNSFLQANRRLGARERLAHLDAIATIKNIRYASTLWAATRRSGEYSGLNIVHQVGVGAARDAKMRCESWFISLNAFLNALKADEGLKLAEKTIDQIGRSAAASKAAFLENMQRAGMEVYREPLTQSPVWAQCASEWGQGSGFKMRVAQRIERFFDSNPKLKESLEDIANVFWEQLVISPLLHLSQEDSAED